MAIECGPMHILDLDDEGFLNNPCFWDKRYAENVAKQYGIETLNFDQWKMIMSLRKYYFSHGTMPPMRRICHLNQLQSNCIAELFDNHGVELWKIAGLPNPGEEAKSYM